MYCPSHFNEERPEVLSQLMRTYPLATVVRSSADGLVADHIPLMYEEAQADKPARLIGHVAKNNVLCQSGSGSEHLLIFQGPNTYVSPNWYPSKAIAGKVVPTWNYAVVHVHATLTTVEDPQAILPILSSLTQRHESSQPHPWQVGDAPQDYIDTMVSNVVGVVFQVRRIQGKWKVSQNQPADNRKGVVSALGAHGTDVSSAMAALVQAAGH